MLFHRQAEMQAGGEEDEKDDDDDGGRRGRVVGRRIGGD